MFNWLRDLMGGCTHRRTTFPMSARNSGMKSHHVTCLDCGSEFDYDWKRMRLAKRRTLLSKPNPSTVTNVSR